MIGRDDLIAAVQQFLNEPLYQPCLVLVHTGPAALAQAVAWLKEDFDLPEWLVGGELAAALLPIAPDDWPAEAARWFRAAAAARKPGPILVSDIPLLFEPALHLDPLRLLREASRQTVFIVAWPGMVDGSRLAYAVAEHSHHRTWSKSDLCSQCIVTL
jgi:hypothetical protein